MKPVFHDLYSGGTTKTTIAKADRVGNADVSSRIAQAFDAASASTGTSFDYLVKTAQRESSMNPSAQAKTSSATGLFQFIESTWLETMKLSGDELGLGQYAAAIAVDANGRYNVADPAQRKEILALRKDPEISSMMAGALTRRNAELLDRKIGRQPSDGELYIAHFLGAGGASKLIRLSEADPNATAATAFPRQAAANRPIFYNRDGTPRSVSEVYDRLVRDHEAPTRTMLANAPAAAAETTTAFADPATAVSTGDRIAAGWRASDPDAAFDALFRNDGAGKPLASAFWKGFAATPGLFAVAVAEDAAASAAATAAATPAVAPVSPAMTIDPITARIAAAEQVASGAADSPSIAALAARMQQQNGGPLDLGSFLLPTAWGDERDDG